MIKRHREQSKEYLLCTPRTDLCLDFANTLAWRGSTPAESLHGLADVLEWCQSNSNIALEVKAATMNWARAHPAEQESLFREMIAIRESIYRIFHALACNGAPPDKDVAALNRKFAACPERTHIESSKTGFGWRVESSNPTAATMLAPVLWSAGALLTGTPLTKVRECANRQCLWLFVDDSRNGTRRWCSMQACGNRAKARRHYLRHSD